MQYIYSPLPTKRNIHIHNVLTEFFLNYLFAHNKQKFLNADI